MSFQSLDREYYNYRYTADLAIIQRFCGPPSNVELLDLLHSIKVSTCKCEQQKSAGSSPMFKCFVVNSSNTLEAVFESRRLGR